MTRMPTMRTGMIAAVPCFHQPLVADTKQQE